MKKLFKPASLLLYLLSLLVFLLLGMIFAGITGAGKGQGLAGGAIVLGYGVMSSFFALIGSVLIAYFASNKVVVNANRILGILFLIAAGVFAYRYMVSEGKKQPSENKHNQPTAPVRNISLQKITAPPVSNPLEKDTPMGLGFFMPNFYENSVLYFYGAPNFEKSTQEHSPTDSVVFKKLEQGGFDITYAPPWLVPDHLKLDYDMLYFRIQSIGRDFVEVTANTQTQQAAYVDRYAGKITYWPDFLLSVNSVEFISGLEQTVKVKPLDISGEVRTAFQFMSPVLIKENWMMVHLMNDDYEKVGEGWVQWRKDNKLLIGYSLLS